MPQNMQRLRVVVWFSAGVTSAVAAKLAHEKYKNTGKAFHLVYCDTGGEHPSNVQFGEDVANWIGVPLEVLRSKYTSHWDVFEKTKYIAGIKGARCTTELKKALRMQYQRVWEDIQVFGFSMEETKRAETFQQNNPEVTLECPLIDHNLTKNDCFAIIKKAKIDLPFMYQNQKSGAPYNHNNCIGCPKGGAGYWNKIRIDFPDAFDKMAILSRKLGAKIIRVHRQRVYLDELPPDYGDFGKEPAIDCGLSCGLALSYIGEDSDE